MILGVEKTYQMKNGGSVRLICTDRASAEYPVIGLSCLNTGAEFETIMFYTLDGRCSTLDKYTIQSPMQEYVRLDNVVETLKFYGFKEQGEAMRSIRALDVKEFPK